MCKALIHNSFIHVSNCYLCQHFFPNKVQIMFELERTYWNDIRTLISANTFEQVLRYACLLMNQSKIKFGASAPMLMQKRGSVGLQNFNFCFTFTITVPLMDAASNFKRYLDLDAITSKPHDMYMCFSMNSYKEATNQKHP